MQAALPVPFAPLRYQPFRVIWTATLAANLGSLVQGVGAGWMMTELSASHDMIALVQAAATLPIMVMALPAGALADNYDRRRIMLFAQCFMAVISGLLALASWFGLVSSVTLLAFTFLLGLGTALHLPSWQASMRDLVPREVLPAAVTLNAMSYNLTRALGPAAGGLIVAWAGPPAAFALNAVSYFALIYALFRWRPAVEPRSLPAEHLHSAMAAGLRYVSLSPDLMRLMARSFLFGLSAVSLLALLPVITRDLLHAEAAVYGLLLAAFGIGAVVGAIAIPFLRRRLGIEATIAGAFVLSAAGLLIVAFSRGLLPALPGVVACGTAWVSALSLFNVSAQLSTPRWVIGRVLAVYQTCTFGGMALGSWLWGALSNTAGPMTALVAAAGAMVFGALVGRVMRMADLSDADLDPANRFHEPALRLNLRARSGPIMVMVDWIITPEDTVLFLREMNERRRVRLRDGARRWSLLRDLENPDLWVETYHVATWADYIRHNQRRTMTDIQIHDRLLALHSGPGAPVVHRMVERRTVAVVDDMPIIERPKQHL